MSDDWFQLETQRQAHESLELADSHRISTQDWSDLSLLRPIALTFLCAMLVVVAATTLL